MVLSLLQPFNASFVPSAYPTPVAPDNFVCNDDYADPKPPVRADCQAAFEQLPTGDGLEPFSYHFSDDDPNQLPIHVTHGTCEIWFHTSGEQYQELDPIIINPKDIRNMAGFILDECVSGSRTGGAMMKGVKKATDWILDLRSRFPYRLMPPSTTFYSLNIWEDSGLITESDWNPGNFDPHLGFDIAEYVGHVAHRAPAGSARRDELERRYELLIGAVRKMDFGTEHAWWDCDPLLNTLRSNESVLALGNSSTTTRVVERRLKKKRQKLDASSSE